MSKLSKEKPSFRRRFKGKPFEEMDIEELRKESKSQRISAIINIFMGFGIFLFGIILIQFYPNVFTLKESFAFSFIAGMLFASGVLIKAIQMRYNSRADILEFFELSMEGNKELLKGFERLGKKLDKLTKDQKEKIKKT